MAVTVTDVTERFDEFSVTNSALIASCLGEAERAVSSDAFGDSYDDAVLFLTAHKLAMTPAGEQFRLQPKSDPYKDGTDYHRQYREMLEALPPCPVMG